MEVFSYKHIVIFCLGAVLASIILMLYGEDLLVVPRIKTNSEAKCQLDSTKQNTSSFEYDVQEQLQQLQRVIKRANMHVRGTKTSNELRKATKILNEIMELFPKQDSQPWRKSVEPTSVCPEEYQDKQSPWFKINNCTHAKSLKELITIIVQSNYTELTRTRLSILLNSTRNYYKDVNVILVSNSNLTTRDTETANIKIVIESNVPDGEVLNKLVKQVKTPYVLIARNVEMLTNDAKLERLIREIETQQIPVAAGAVRDRQGHWDIGCYQTVMRNFSLKYFHGYDESFHECVFCDFAAGPFVTSVKTIETFPFAAVQERNGLFEDWYLRLTKENVETIVCPDSMFFTTYRQEDSQWQYFMTKWNLWEINTPGGKTITSECTDKLWETPITTALSPCKMKANTHGTNDVMELCEKHSIICQLNVGTALGAVKFGHVLPWDIDVDINVLSQNFTAYRDFLSKVFKVTGYENACETRYYIAYADHWNIDVCEMKYLDSVELIAAGLTPTRVLYDGHWLAAPRNPGLFVREIYGRELFQHALHFRHTETSPRAAYKPNMFLQCRLPGDHRCLDTYNGDGNMQFKHMLP